MTSLGIRHVGGPDIAGDFYGNVLPVNAGKGVEHSTPGAILKSLAAVDANNKPVEHQHKNLMLRKLVVEAAETSSSKILVSPPQLATSLVKNSPTDDKLLSIENPSLAQESASRFSGERKLPVWHSLRSLDAKLYAWFCAVKLSSGVGAGLDFHETRYGRRHEEALEAVTRMLDYLRLEDEEIGSRLDVTALREIGADYEITTKARFSGGDLDSSRNVTSCWRQANPSNVASVDHVDGKDAVGCEQESCKHLSSMRGGSGLAIAQHLAAFRFQRVVSDPTTIEIKRLKSPSPVDASAGNVLVSAASAAAAKAFGLEQESSISVNDRNILRREDDVHLTHVEDRINTHKTIEKFHSSGATNSNGVISVEQRSDHRQKKCSSVRPHDLPCLELYPKTRAVAALHRAISHGDKGAVQTAAIRGAGSAGAFEVGAFVTMARALHVAAACEGALGAPAAGIIEALATTGADVCAPDALGYTPIHVAAATGNVEALKILLQFSQEQDKTDGPRRAAARRCHNGFTPLEIAMARRRDMREFLASMLCRARAFDVLFSDQGSLGIKLALVRHASLSSFEFPHQSKRINSTTRIITSRNRPAVIAPPPPPSKDWNHALRKLGADESLQTREPTKSAVRIRNHGRAVSSHDSQNFPHGSIGPYTLQVTSVTPECRAAHDIEIGDQLLAINGAVLACPDEAGFPIIMAELKQMARPLRVTFAAGNYPYLSIEDDPIISILLPVSPQPQKAQIDCQSMF